MIDYGPEDCEGNEYIMKSCVCPQCGLGGEQGDNLLPGGQVRR